MRLGLVACVEFRPRAGFHVFEDRLQVVELWMRGEKRSSDKVFAARMPSARNEGEIRGQIGVRDFAGDGSIGIEGCVSPLWYTIGISIDVPAESARIRGHFTGVAIFVIGKELLSQVDIN